MTLLHQLLTLMITLKDVRSNCFCASLLRMKFTRHVMHGARALSIKVNNNRENGHCYNFEWMFGDPFYLPFDGSFSLPIFYVLRRGKNEKNLSSRNFIFLQNAPSNSVHLASSFSYAAVANASLRVDVCENDGNII